MDRWEVKMKKTFFFLPRKSQVALFAGNWADLEPNFLEKENQQMQQIQKQKKKVKINYQTMAGM